MHYRHATNLHLMIPTSLHTRRQQSTPSRQRNLSQLQNALSRRLLSLSPHRCSFFRRHHRLCYRDLYRFQTKRRRRAMMWWVLLKIDSAPFCPAYLVHLLTFWMLYVRIPNFFPGRKPLVFAKKFSTVLQRSSNWMSWITSHKKKIVCWLLHAAGEKHLHSFFLWYTGPTVSLPSSHHW